MLTPGKKNNNVKDYELKSLDLVKILYSDAVTKPVLSVWELLLEWWLESNSNVTMELISSTKTIKINY